MFAPYPHQAKELAISKDLKIRALWWEPGTGKTKVMLDTARHLFGAGEIDGLLVVAPNGVHQNWILDEIPKHVPADELAHWTSFVWSSQGRHSQAARKVRDHFLKWPGAMKVLAISYSGIMTDDGALFARDFLKVRQCLYVADESHYIKTPGSRRTKRVLASARYAPYRRVLTGTPVANKPFDVYSQTRFLDPNIWKSLDIGSATAFRSRFGIYAPNTSRGRFHLGELVGYRNIEEMNSVVMKLGDRIRTDDVLDLPPQIFQTVRFDMPPKQARVYREMQAEFRAYLGSGQEVTADLAMTRLIRLQQIASGYVTDDSGILRRITVDNPRVKLVANLAKESDQSVIIWAKYSEDVDQLAAALGRDAVVYDGRTPDADRLIARRRFQAGDVKIFISKPSAAGTGLTLHRAKLVIYYNNSYNLADRIQSEGRPHRAGMADGSVLYLDVVANGTVDEAIAESCRTKRQIAEEVLKCNVSRH